jgi:hypothetical protein
LQITLTVSPTGEFDARVADVAEDVAVTVIDRRERAVRGGVRR